MRQGRFTLDYGLQQGIDGYTDGTRWNGWSTPWFTFENASTIVELLTAEYAKDEGITPPEGTGGYLADEDAFYFYDVDDSLYSLMDVTFGRSMTLDDGTKLYPFGGGAWCWMEDGVHYTD